jgi:hypothetical protein
LVCRKDGILKKVPFVSRLTQLDEDCKVYSGRTDALKPGIRKLAMRGRKLKQESRSTEFRQRLIAWKQTLESSRPSRCKLLERDQMLQAAKLGLGSIGAD